MGTLYLVSTPIGNLEDVTLRALRVLREVDIIAAEDTRHTRKLLDRYEIETPLLSYHDHNEAIRLQTMLDHLSRGSVALVSDAGTPLVSDPGFKLVRAAAAAGHEVSPIPGPSAPMAAIVASGLPTDSFVFLGWLPRKAGRRQVAIQKLASEPRTMLAMEAPHRLRETLRDLEAVFGPERQIAICRELTKRYEEIIRGSLSEVREQFEREEPRGEITLVIGGADWMSEWDEASVREVVSRRISEGMRRSEAARQVAAETGWPRREVYRLAEEAE
ncbi:MAG: 16S rRNA (cytidine(1402)-2'-O)-methyltransferase [Chloroflexi bacterium]|nr:16S rRNA (cytidine(1402)-2'-O)-methyltransferase [Chloroflexota bacterium]